MTQLTFKKPSIADQASILSFRQAFNAKCPAMHGSNELNAFTDGGFIGWLNYINAPSGTNWFDYEKVADSTYIALQDDAVVGIMHLRHHLNNILVQRGGHIGYSVHPDFQGRGIATKMLAFAIDVLRQLDVADILVTCETGNIASKKVILKQGGVLENVLTIHTPNRTYDIERYRIRP